MRACVAAGEHRRWVVDDGGRQVPDSPSRAAARSGLATAGTDRPVPVSWLAQVERAPEADVMSFIDRRRTPVSQVGNDETEPSDRRAVRFGDTPFARRVSACLQAHHSTLKTDPLLFF